MENIESNFFHYLNGFSTNVQDVLSKFDFDKTIKRMVDSNTLALSCQIISANSLKGDTDVTNDMFAENAWYFRNSLVRANYNDLKKGIHETTEFLEVFLRNLLLNEKHPLHNRTLHIGGTFKEIEKPDIDALKPDIEIIFQPKTASHILKLREAFPGQTIFGRSDVMKAIDIKTSRASDLLREMVEHGVVEPVPGHGKGKYRFRQH